LDNRSLISDVGRNFPAETMFTLADALLSSYRTSARGPFTRR